MKETIRKFKLFTIADYEEEQEWLIKMHSQGLKLVKVGLCMYTFVKTTPENYVYQLEFLGEKPSDDYLQMFKDFGWEYVGCLLGWNYFRKKASQTDDIHDLEIFSDPESKAKMVEKVFTTRMLPLLIILCAIIIPNLIQFREWKPGSFDMAIGIVFMILFVLYITIILYCGVKLLKKRKELKH